MKSLNNRPSGERKTLSAEKKRLVISTSVNSILLSIVYFGAIYGITDPALQLIPTIISIGYWVAFGVLLLVYVIYNRALTRKKLTPDMLPTSWSKEKKDEYIENGKTRLKKSEWMLSVLIPLLAPIALDALYLFTIPMIERMFNIKF